MLSQTPRSPIIAMVASSQRWPCSMPLRPLHLVVRETEFLRAETGGRFQAQNAGERPEFGSQTANRLTNRPESRGYLSTWKPRRFAGTEQRGFKP